MVVRPDRAGISRSFIQKQGSSIHEVIVNSRNKTITRFGIPGLRPFYFTPTDCHDLTVGPIPWLPCGPRAGVNTHVYCDRLKQRGFRDYQKRKRNRSSFYRHGIKIIMENTRSTWKNPQAKGDCIWYFERMVPFYSRLHKIPPGLITT